jgi:hypothetical protein
MTTPSPPGTPPTVVNTPETVDPDTPGTVENVEGENILFISPLHPYNNLLQTPPIQGKHLPTPSTIVAIMNPNNGRSYILHKKLEDGSYVPFTTGDNPKNNIYYKIGQNTFELYKGRLEFLKKKSNEAINLSNTFNAEHGGNKLKNGKKTNKTSKTSKTSKKSKSKSKKTKKQKRSKK